MGRDIAVPFHDRGTRWGWVVSSTPRPHVTPGKEPVSILQEAKWAPGPVWTGGKSVPTGIRSLTFHPIVSRYTDWATQPTQSISIYLNSNLMLCPSSYSFTQTAAFQMIFPQMFRCTYVTFDLKFLIVVSPTAILKYLYLYFEESLQLQGFCDMTISKIN